MSFQSLVKIDSRTREPSGENTPPL